MWTDWGGVASLFLPQITWQTFGLTTVLVLATALVQTGNGAIYQRGISTALRSILLQPFHLLLGMEVAGSMSSAMAATSIYWRSTGMVLHHGSGWASKNRPATPSSPDRPPSNLLHPSPAVSHRAMRFWFLTVTTT